MLRSARRLPRWGDVPGAVARGLTVWRRSVAARVVVSTVLLSAVVVGAVSWLLVAQVREGLLDNRVRAGTAEAESETAQAVERLTSASTSDFDVASQLEQVALPLSQRGSVRGYEVLLVRSDVPVDDDLTGVGSISSPGLDPDSIPASLRDHFAGSNQLAWTWTELRVLSGEEMRSVPGLVVGTRIQLPADGEAYTLYFLFALDDEQETLDVVTRAAVVAAALLVVLIGGVTWVVARQVVTPIRMARKVAERLAAGRLQERLRVSGRDDLARLASSFNQMASNLQRQIQQLEELSRVQRRFVADVSHELRTPLTTVRMAGDLLHDARQDFDPAAARAAELLQVELDRFEVLLGELLEISRYDAGAVALELEDVDLREVAARVVQQTATVASGSGVDVRVRQPGAPCMTEADGRRVERVVRNLVTNAIDHAESREVVITVDGDEHSAAIAVRDYGVGLAPGESAMVFNRFWRADPARARTTGGTGLGLSIALEDAHLHGGWLQAWGTPGGGAQFRLTLPRRAGEQLRRSPIPLLPSDAEPER
ncbi:MtrAB system histidine kinase MtrB [Nocardioides zeae]|uniref:Sensor histidine kinase MtrB n=1 Tax=Nocardioides imazamoxiresistens TaxID=3231893 RepID=A0ABU3Q0M9_9ACTN|nr:MtrAB system histidine kinase MtrB [Nocardioides zeae]MDT9594919.1 MtrAB system histidine kinase MtrB [Nocardioides zeae]